MGSGGERSDGGARVWRQASIFEQWRMKKRAQRGDGGEGRVRRERKERDDAVRREAKG